MAAEIMTDKTRAHAVLVKEELGINVDELNGSAMEAALYSFLLFSIGGIIPLIPFIFFSGLHAIVMSIAFSALGLFIIGAAITLFTGKNLWFSGFRMVFFGLIAAAITYGIGNLIGIAIA
jgi:VIT1/CCC1 family predicted Fe2+/Mn2+ transporter